MCGSMVDIQSPAAEIRLGKKKIERKIVTTGQKYNGPLFHRAAITTSTVHHCCILVALTDECVRYFINTRMWANAQRDGRPAEYRWRPLFNAAKFG